MRVKSKYVSTRHQNTPLTVCGVVACCEVFSRNALNQIKNELESALVEE